MKVILIKNAVETLGYFSEQLAETFQEMGHDTCFVDYDDLVNTVDGIGRFAVAGKTVLCTFNFIGLSGEEVFIEENGHYIWENRGIACINILVDHPLYYHSKLAKPPVPDMRVFCIDREHVAYMKRFYPSLPAKFLPLAGNCIREQEIPCSTEGCHRQKMEFQNIPYRKRNYDVVFTGNYMPVEHLYREIDRQGAEYRTFYYEILEDMKAHPAVSIDQMLETHVRKELGEVPDEELRAAIAGMVFIDICMRSYFRGEIIKCLADHKIPVHVFGANWEKLDCSSHDYIIKNGREVDSVTCVKTIADARISLNIMPWFKDGAHDRVFTAMLQHTLSLTDDSRYLRENFKDKNELVFYSLERKEELPELVWELLGKPEECMEIAERGYETAVRAHTWKQRAEEILIDLVK